MPWVKTRFGETAKERSAKSTPQRQRPEPSLNTEPARPATRAGPAPKPAGKAASTQATERPARTPPTGLGSPITESDWSVMESLPQDAEHPAPLEEARAAKRSRVQASKQARAAARFSQMMEDPALKHQAEQRLNEPVYRILMAQDGRVPEPCLLLQADAWTEGVPLRHPLIREWSCHLPPDQPWPTSAEWKALPKPGLADPVQVQEIIEWTSERRIALLRYAAEQQEDRRGDMRALDTLMACMHHHRPQRGG